MKAFLQRRRAVLVDFLRSRKMLVLVVLVLGVGEVFELVGAGAAVYSAHKVSALTFWLRLICFGLVIIWTSIRLHERYQKELKR